MVEVDDRLYLRLDAEGRWTGLGEGGALFRRTVDGRVLRPEGKGFAATTEAEAQALHAHAARRAEEFARALALSDATTFPTGDDREAVLRVLRLGACQVASPAEDRAAYEAAYPEPVPILPPHRYRDLVVMPATGCPNHACRFCAFYRDRSFRVLDEAAFREHLHAVHDLFGAALEARDGIFLGSAAALVLGEDLLRARLRAVTDVFGRPRRGVAGFHDADRGRERSAEAWRRLHDDGLTEATLGLETGSASLREAQGKSPHLDRFVRCVRSAREGGLAVSLTVLVGLGGTGREVLHREATVALVERCALGPADRVYLSPLLDAEPSLVDAEALAAWRRPLRDITSARLGDYRIERFAFLT